MPDGIIPLNQSIIYLAFAGIVIGISIWQSRKSLTLKQIPIVGVLAAGLFAAQMFNFPIPFGSSGHLIGTALATSLVGPWSAILIMSAILIVQALFGDGGLLAFGVNAFNMAIIGAFTTYLFFVVLPKKVKQKKEMFALFAGIGGFLSTMMMAFFASLELIFASVGNPGLIFGWMFALHAIIGAAEFVITFAIVFFIFKADASLFEAAEDSLYMRSRIDVDKTVPPRYKFPVTATITTIGVFGIMAVFGLIASENPDGLERTFEFLEAGGSDLSILDSGLFGLGEGFGWAVLQMAIIMVIFFSIILAVSFVVYFVRKAQYNKYQTEQLALQEEISEEDEFNETQKTEEDDISLIKDEKSTI